VSQLLKRANLFEGFLVSSFFISIFMLVSPNVWLVWCVILNIFLNVLGGVVFLFFFWV
jgi:hypothetical protein